MWIGHSDMTNEKTFRYTGLGESGLTLVEMLMAVSILVIIGGSTYFAFKTAVDTYHKTEARILAAQRCRFAMDRLVTDLSNMQVSPEEPELAMYTQDGPGTSGERDTLSFVTVLRTDPDPFFEQLSAVQSQSSPQVPSPLLSDVQRVAYFAAEAPPPGQSALGTGDFRGTFSGDAGAAPSGRYALFRLATTSLDPESVIAPFLQTGTVPETDENGNPVHVDVATLVLGLVGFDLQYFDSATETWNTSWEDPESFPTAVQILLTVHGEVGGAARSDSPQLSGQGQSIATPNGMTQSTMVYLPAAAGRGAQGAP